MLVPTDRADLRPDRPQSVSWDIYQQWLIPRWRKLLNSDPPESAVQKFLESHPVLLPGGMGDIGPGGHHGPELEAACGPTGSGRNATSCGAAMMSIL